MSWETWQLDPVGGSGGIPFSDSLQLQSDVTAAWDDEQFRSARIWKICVQHGEAIDSVQLWLTSLAANAQYYPLGRHGGAGGRFWGFDLWTGCTLEGVMPSVTVSGAYRHLYGIAGWCSTYDDMLVVTRLYFLIGNYERNGMYWLGPLGRAVPKGGVFPGYPSSSETQKWDVDAFHPPADGKWFEQFAPQGHDVIGFSGRSGGLLDAIGIVFRRI